MDFFFGKFFIVGKFCERARLNSNEVGTVTQLQVAYGLIVFWRSKKGVPTSRQTFVRDRSDRYGRTSAHYEIWWHIGDENQDTIREIHKYN